MTTVLLQGRIAAEQHEFFKRITSPDWTLLVWHPATDSIDKFIEYAAQADVIVGGNIPLDVWPSTPKLKLFQIPWTGFNFTSPERMPDGIPVANCFEHETAIAEYVMLGMLEWRINMRAMHDRFCKEGWGGRGPANGIYHGEVMGNTVGIVGYGHIGEEIARRAKAFGMNVIGTRRKSTATPAELRWLGGTDKLLQLLAESDFVVLACDLNDSTHHLIDTAAIQKMKPSSVLINVARGEIVDEKALYCALSERKIGGAILDVWYNYKSPNSPRDKLGPWPSNLPFEKLDNVILTAHECCWTREQVARRWQFVADNVSRVINGQTAENVVFTGSAAR